MPPQVPQSTLDPDMSGKIQDFNRGVALAAEELIFKTLPKKILELQALIAETDLESSEYSLSNIHTTTDVTVYPPPTSSSSNSSPDPKRRKRSVGDVSNGEPVATQDRDSGGAIYPQRVVANHHIRKLQERNKLEFQALIELCDKVKLWINLTMPRIEDGDNFGVQIQEEVLNELGRAQESAYGLRDTMRVQHGNRAKICSKLIKYPNVEDYVLALRDHDEKQLFMTRQHLHDVRNVYAILFDILQKNIQKIRSPKGNNSLGMY
ncbi:proteasome activator pa28 REG alpha/beta subunit [Cantharellus anzutake]|uniref:proteasome activator pa28 REG alpha/beta subunit n=1 Tax=Cantharellus anzutake TaxID=1750568 RepID=UPI0019036505|nr:proteasome activator pa28 REG alpha/beta subunit [Cantharellus anzutake]KAF8338020.1 proteasome activator pa28 REG alpha/beta subunit [Cantharellus anzutake]